MNNPEKLATYCTRDEEQQNKKHNTICGGHRYALTHTNKVNKTSGLIQTTGGKDEPKHRFIRTEIVTDITTRNSERKDT